MQHVFLYLILVNICVLYVFTRKDNLSPVTELLSCFAVTDSLTAISTVVIDFCGFYLFHNATNRMLCRRTRMRVY